MIRVAAIVGAILLAMLAWQTHRATKATKALAASEAALAKSTAQIAAEQAARAHEQEIAKNASNEFQRTVTTLQDELAARPLKPVVIRVPARSSLPQANGAAGAATGSDAEAEGRLDATVEVDIAAELTDYALDCQRNSAQLDALQGWVRAR